MAVTDMWHLKDGKTRSKRYGRGLQWQVRVGDHPAKSFRTKRAAQDYERDLLSRPTQKLRTDVTVNDLLDSYVAGKKGLSKSGYDGARNGAAHARERWGSALPYEVFTHEIQIWVADMTIVKRGPKGSRTIAPAGVDVKDKSLAALRGAMAIAVQTGMIDANPCVGVKTGRAERRDARFLTMGQLRQLASKPERSADRAMILFIGTTGLRISECCRVNVEDMVQRKGSGWRVHVRKTKNGRPRDVPVPLSVVQMLDLNRPGDEPLFTAPRGGRNGKDNWRERAFDPAAEALGLDIVPHDLRHTAASLMIKSGATVKDVQNALGHKTATMTLDLYAGWWDDGLDDVSSRMDQMMKDADSA